MQKKKPRVSINIETLFIGDEPTFGNPKTEMGIARSLSWYSNQYGSKESKRFTLEYAKENKYSKQIITKLTALDEAVFKNIGFVCRIVSRGANLGMERIGWVDSKIKELSEYVPDNHVSSITSSTNAVVKQEKSIQDRVFEQSTIYINEIEGNVDDFIKNRKSEFKCYDWLKANSVKPIYINHIKDHYKPLVEELTDASDKKDEQLIESYSHWSKKELKSFLQFITGIISDCEKYVGSVKTIRKPRKKKAVPLEKKVSAVKYQKESIEYKVASISPTDIIGAKQLWVFNSKTKKLGLYVAQDDSGFGVKGTTITGYDENISVCKTLRKPETVLPTVTKGKKTDLKKVMSNINSKESPLNGRINQDTILLKVA